MNEKKLLLKLNAVKGIARRAGYPEYKAEDIAQQVALKAIEGRNIEKQSNFYSYVDALREGSERAYSRTGHFTVPIYESSFENYSNIINALGCETDPGSIEESECDVYDIVCALQKIERSRGRIIVLKFLYGWTMARISKYEGVCEARISQKCSDALKQIKKKVIQARLSQEKQSKRKLEEYRAISQEIQSGSELQEKTKRELARIQIKKGYFLAAFQIKEIPEVMAASF